MLNRVFQVNTFTGTFPFCPGFANGRAKLPRDSLCLAVNDGRRDENGADTIRLAQSPFFMSRWMYCMASCAWLSCPSTVAGAVLPRTCCRCRCCCSAVSARGGTNRVQKRPPPAAPAPRSCPRPRPPSPLPLRAKFSSAVPRPGFAGKPMIIPGGNCQSKLASGSA